MKQFRTYQLAVRFNHEVATLKLSGHMKDQLKRAAASVALNLAEGSGRFGQKDQKRFFQIALASLRECQAVFDIENIGNSTQRELLDSLGAHLFKLIRAV